MLRTARRGMTLIELAVVLVIAAILVTLVWNWRARVVPSAERAVLRHSLRQFRMAAEMTRAETGSFPSPAAVTALRVWGPGIEVAEYSVSPTGYTLTLTRRAGEERCSTTVTDGADDAAVSCTIGGRRSRDPREGGGESAGGAADSTGRDRPSAGA